MCDNCFGTGESDYGKELWEVHECPKCKGTGRIASEE